MNYAIIPLEQRIRQLKEGGNPSVRAILSMWESEWFDVANHIVGCELQDPAASSFFDSEGRPQSIAAITKTATQLMDIDPDEFAKYVGYYFCFPLAEINKLGEDEPEKDPSQEMLDMLDELFGIDIGEE